MHGRAEAAPGWQGAVLKLLRAGDYRLTVTGRREISPHYLRLSFDGGRDAHRPAAAPDDVGPDVVRRWRQAASAGLHTRRSRPGRRHRRHRVRPARRGGLALGAGGAARRQHRGDGAGQQFHAARAETGWLPHRRRHRVAARHQLAAGCHRRRRGAGVPGSRPDDDKELPELRSADITWVDRQNAGEALVEAVSSSAFDASDHFGWVACDNRTTRAVGQGVPRGLQDPAQIDQGPGLLGGLTGQAISARSSAATDVAMLEENRRFSSSTGPSRSILASAL